MWAVRGIRFLSGVQIIVQKIYRFFYNVRLEIVCNENVAHLRFFATVAGNKRSFSHVNFRDGDRKRQNSRNKLPEYRSYVANDVKQSDLNGANLLYCFHHVTKSSERE